MTQTQKTTTALILEDEPVALQAFSAMLELKGVHVLRATSVAQGLEQLKLYPDYLICDVMLPDGSGEEVMLANLKSPRPSKLIVTTAINDDEVVGRLWAYGPIAIMRKPFKFATFFHVLEL